MASKPELFTTVHKDRAGSHYADEYVWQTAIADRKTGEHSSPLPNPAIRFGDDRLQQRLPFAQDRIFGELCHNPFCRAPEALA